MLELSRILDRQCVRLELSASRKKEAIAELIDMVKKAGKIKNINTDSLLKDMLSREKISSTGIGSGVAIPHKLVEGLDKTVMAFGRKKEGINFDSIDGKPATLFFLILGKEGSSSNHLRLLSRLARLLHDPVFRDSLENAQNPDDVIDAIARQEEE